VIPLRPRRRCTEHPGYNRRLGLWPLDRNFTGNGVVVYARSAGELCVHWVSDPSSIDEGLWVVFGDEILAEARDRQAEPS
jgi:hypothetical protein